MHEEPRRRQDLQLVFENNNLDCTNRNKQGDHRATHDETAAELLNSCAAVFPIIFCRCFSAETPFCGGALLRSAVALRSCSSLRHTAAALFALSRYEA